MRRRHFVAGALGVPVLLNGCSMADVAQFPTLAAALKTLEALPAAARTKSGWDLARVLHHAAQSVEFSMQGFPQLKSGLFRATVGKAAFAVFDGRGRMSHGLDEPIPGAPVLAEGAPRAEARARLLKALRDFDAWTGPLQPHFAYGALDKPAFARAHLMHLADHWSEVIA